MAATRMMRLLQIWAGEGLCEGVTFGVGWELIFFWRVSFAAEAAAEAAAGLLNF